MEKGLCSTASSVLSDFDSAAQLTLATQTRLSEALHRLNQELDRLLADAPAPFTMHYAGKICGVRKRVSSLNSLLGSVQRRLDNIDRLISLNERTEAREHSQEDHTATNTINGRETEKERC